MLSEIPIKYRGECIALINGEIIAVGKTQLEAYKKAKSLYPKKMVTLMCVPKKKEVVTFL